MADLQNWFSQPNGDTNPHQLETIPASSAAWEKAERRTYEIILCIQPSIKSEQKRNQVIGYVENIIQHRLGYEVFAFGSVPLKTYLPHGDIDLAAFSPYSDEKLANDVFALLEAEENNASAKCRVRDVRQINAEVKLVKCLVEDIVVDISFNQLGGLCTLCFLEQVDFLIQKDHLFKRGIILVKAWCFYESRILGAHHNLLSTYALEVLVLYIFHLYYASLQGPLEVLYRFLEHFSKFDWDNYCVSLQGPVAISSLPNICVKPLEGVGNDALAYNKLMNGCIGFYSSLTKEHDYQSRSLTRKHLNIIDPLRDGNNLGRSVNKANFHRIRSAFTYGAKKLEKILLSSEENIIKNLDSFFPSVLARHGNGQRPDVRDSIFCYVETESCMETVDFGNSYKQVSKKGYYENSNHGTDVAEGSESTESVKNGNIENNQIVSYDLPDVQLPFLDECSLKRSFQDRETRELIELSCCSSASSKCQHCLPSQYDKENGVSFQEQNKKSRDFNGSCSEFNFNCCCRSGSCSDIDKSCHNDALTGNSAIHVVKVGNETSEQASCQQNTEVADKSNGAILSKIVNPEIIECKLVNESKDCISSRSLCNRFANNDKSLHRGLNVSNWRGRCSNCSNFVPKTSMLKEISTNEDESLHRSSNCSYSSNVVPKTSMLKEISTYCQGAILTEAFHKSEVLDLLKSELNMNMSYLVSQSDISSLGSTCGSDDKPFGSVLEALENLKANLESYPAMHGDNLKRAKQYQDVKSQNSILPNPYLSTNQYPWNMHSYNNGGFGLNLIPQYHVPSTYGGGNHVYFAGTYTSDETQKPRSSGTGSFIPTMTSGAYRYSHRNKHQGFSNSHDLPSRANSQVHRYRNNGKNKSTINRNAESQIENASFDNKAANNRSFNRDNHASREMNQPSNNIDFNQRYGQVISDIEIGHENSISNFAKDNSCNLLVSTSFSSDEVEFGSYGPISLGMPGTPSSRENKVDVDIHGSIHGSTPQKVNGWDNSQRYALMKDDDFPPLPVQTQNTKCSNTTSSFDKKDDFPPLSIYKQAGAKLSQKKSNTSS